MMRRLVCALAVAAVAAAAGCGGGSSPAPDAAYVRHHEPSQGWTADVPAGWASVAFGPTFARAEPLSDPTRLTLATCRACDPARALRRIAAQQGVVVSAREGERTGEGLRWRRYRGRHRGDSRLAVELAVAESGRDAQVAVLVGRRAERRRLVKTALLPALDSFVPGPPDPPQSVLAETPGDPSYWPTAGWRTATPASQGVDGARLDAMVAKIGAAKLPIDSVTVVRHGHVVLDRSFGRFASGDLGQPFASGPLHELQSATKSVTSMVLGGALQEETGGGVTVATPVVRLASAVGYRPARMDARKRAMTLQDLLTMQSGLEWREWGYAYAPGSGNDVTAMVATDDWARYVIDRPMAARPGTRFVYDSGAAHLVSAVITVLTKKPAADVAAAGLFAALGIHQQAWLPAPEGASSGGFGLRLRPGDLAKLAFLYLHRGRWDGDQIVPVDWVERSTTDHSVDPTYEYGYLWWLDRADGYAYMAGLYGQLAVVAPGEDLVAVITGHLPAAVDASATTRWLLEDYILPATR